MGQAAESNNHMEHCRFGEEGCLWFLLFQEEVERKAEVFTLIAAGLTNFSNRGQGHLGLQISYVAASLRRMLTSALFGWLAGWMAG
ncbi:uncharacterized protein LOC120667279 isoform X2 [Panicum virgatum]|uniref:uncharacterized protein LOC120667279 isoform X2 n=1 Tax=Panicum virgatum TaxID=38727 RepID=UPI0019D5D0B4|nr:uncharacterized protein LOC120667279 isoform X2 [Panicum virgatum]